MPSVRRSDPEATVRRHSCSNLCWLWNHLEHETYDGRLNCSVSWLWIHRLLHTGRGTKRSKDGKYSSKSWYQVVTCPDWQLDEFEILKGRPVKVAVSEPFRRLFLGNIPKLKTRDEMHTFLSSTLDGLMDVITYSTPDNPALNRGFCFLDFDTHTHASVAKKKFTLGSLRVFGSKVLADWADPQQEPDRDIMSTVKVVYVRGLTKEVTEDDILSVFSPYGPIERVKKLKDYAFVHFNERKDALKSIEELNGKIIPHAKIEATLAKPPIDRHTREEMLKNRERRLLSMAQAKHINRLAIDQRCRLRILDGTVIIRGPKVTVLIKDN